MTKADGTSSVSFYSSGASVVTVCSGTAATCRQANSGASIVRTERVEATDVLVLLGRGDDPASVAALPSDLQRFWSEVGLTFATPRWLTDR